MTAMWVIFVSWPHDMMKKAVLYKLVQPTRTVDMQSINIWPLLPNIHRVITISFGYVFISLFFKLLTALLLSACCCDYVPGIICGTRRNSDELDLSWRRSDGNKLDIHSRGERQTFKKPPERFFFAHSWNHCWTGRRIWLCTRVEITL